MGRSNAESSTTFREKLSCEKGSLEMEIRTYRNHSKGIVSRAVVGVLGLRMRAMAYFGRCNPVVETVLLANNVALYLVGA